MKQSDYVSSLFFAESRIRRIEIRKKNARKAKEKDQPFPDLTSTPVPTNSVNVASAFASRS